MRHKPRTKPAGRGIETGRWDHSPWQKQPPFGSGPFSLRGPSTLRLRKAERMASSRLTCGLLGGSLDLFLEPFCFCCWGFGAGSLSDVKEDCETPDLTGGVLAGVGFTHGVPECIGCVTGQFDSAYHCQHLEGRGKRPDPTYGAFVVEGCWGCVWDAGSAELKAHRG